MTDGEELAALAVVRALRSDGFEPWVTVHRRGSVAAWSSAAAGSLELPAPGLDPEGFTAGLARSVGELGVAAVLPCKDAGLVTLAPRVGHFPAGTKIGVCSPMQVARATDKIHLGLLADVARLPYPPWRLISAGDPLDGTRFPVVVKPPRSELIGSDGRMRWYGTRRADDAEALEARLGQLPGGMAMVQPFLQGRLVTVNGVVWEGEVVGTVHKAAVRIWPPKAGHVSYASTVAREPELERGARELLAELGWSGLFNLQLLEHDGRRYLIDLNPRPYHSLALAVAAGANLPAAWLRLLLGLPPCLERYRVGVRFRDESDDARALLRELVKDRRLSALGGMLPRRDTVHAAHAKGDSGPLAAVAGAVVAAGMKRLRNTIRGR